MCIYKLVAGTALFYVRSVPERQKWGKKSFPNRTIKRELAIDGGIHEQIGDNSAEDLASRHAAGLGGGFERKGLPTG